MHLRSNFCGKIVKEKQGFLDSTGGWVREQGSPDAALKAGSNRPFQGLDLYWRTPESINVWHKSRRLKKKICAPSAGGVAGTAGPEPNAPPTLWRPWYPLTLTPNTIELIPTLGALSPLRRGRPGPGPPTLVLSNEFGKYETVPDSGSSSGPSFRAPLIPPPPVSHIIYLIMSFRKSTPP